MFLLNDNPIRIDADLVIGEGDKAITVPALSLQDQATREQYGIVEVADAPRADDRYYWNGDLATPKSIDDIKKLKVNEIAASRFSLETGGVTLINGAQINTERDSQAMVSGALLSVTRKSDTLIDWKGGDGIWTKIDKATIELIADAVSDHVQACFSAERAKCEELSALTTFYEVVAFDPKVTL